MVVTGDNFIHISSSFFKFFFFIRRNRDIFCYTVLYVVDSFFIKVDIFFRIINTITDSDSFINVKCGSNFGVVFKIALNDFSTTEAVK